MRHFAKRSTQLTSAIAIILSAGGLATANAADAIPVYEPPPTPAVVSLPAVSAPNGKLSAFGGAMGSDNFSNDGIYGVTGAFSAPLSHRFGLQVDGMVGGLGENIFGGVAGHLFWRDPSKGLIGIYSSFTALDLDGADNTLGRVGLEGEYYYNRFTAKAFAGYQYGEVGNGFTSTEKFSFYAQDNLAFSIGHQYYEGAGNFGTLGAEYQMQPWNQSFTPALYIDGRVGEDSFYSVRAGLRLYFGSNKSLIDRHRQDDPGVILPDDIFAIANSQRPASGGPSCYDEERDGVNVNDLPSCESLLIDVTDQ